MSLNDPHWGRGPSGDSQNEKRPAAQDDDQAPGRSDGQASDDARRSERSERDEREGGGSGRDPRRQNDDDLDQLWNDFRGALKGLFGDNGPQQKNDRLSQLKSRDDFSREDDEAQPRGGERDRAQSEERGAPKFGMPSSGGFGQGGGGKGGKPVFEFRLQLPKRRSSGAGQGIGMGVIAACVAIGWAASGFYIVPEGQSGVETTFGRYSTTTGPGFHWHAPYPIQAMELVDVSSVRTVSIGARASSDRLREALMLTDDENIVDVQFTVQYRIKPGSGASDYLFNTRAPETSVYQAAESAMREVVGRKTMDSVLFESKAEIAEAVKKSMQQMLDRYGTGIDVMSVAIQNAQPPQQVQAAFNDAVKAGQDRERAINLGEAYMNAVIPKARGDAARLTEQAEGYKARVIEMAQGDASRFTSVYEQYKNAPQVTRDRLYIDAMRDVYVNVSKVMVDQKSGSSLLYLPLDKIVASTQAAAKKEAQDAVDAAAGSASSSFSGAAADKEPHTSNTGGAVYSTESTEFEDSRAMIRARTRQ